MDPKAPFGVLVGYGKDLFREKGGQGGDTTGISQFFPASYPAFHRAQVGSASVKVLSIQTYGMTALSVQTLPGVSLTAIYRYPVKGLSPEFMDCVDLQPGEPLPWDRAFAIENGPGRFDPMKPTHVPKINFLTLMRHTDLATVSSTFEPETQTLTISRDGGQVARGSLATPAGRAIIAQFFAEYMKDSVKGPPKVVHAQGHVLSDSMDPCVHIVNLGSVADVERIVAQPLDPIRFRPNLIVTGAPAWSEFDWVGKTVKIGDVEFEVIERTERCAATNVDPSTGRRDLDIPAILLRSRGHSDMGVYARVKTPGRVRIGEVVSLA